MAPAAGGGGRLPVNNVAPWCPGSPARQPLPFDHAHALWQDRPATAGALSVLWQTGKNRRRNGEEALMSPTITIKVAPPHQQHPESVSRIEIPPAHWYIVALRMLWRDPKFRTHRPHLRKKLASLFKQNMHHHGVRGERKLALKAAAQAVLRSPFGGRLRENVVSVLVGHS